MRLRSRLALSGGLGLVGGAVLMGGALFLWQRTVQKPLVTGWGVWLLLAFLLAFSLAEMPIMIIGMRHMRSSQVGLRLAVLTNAAFIFFAAVYAVPFLLLTGRTGVGLALASLSLLRLAAALWCVPMGLGDDHAPD